MPELGIYLHVPFCASRCGYCDFNTYTPKELGAAGSTSDYLEAAKREIELAAQTLGPREVSTIFVGGGTPTMLQASELTGLLKKIAESFPLSSDAEITTEANPDTLDAEYLETLRAGGFTRLSLGMQSARSHVLQILDRTHTPGRAEACVSLARSAGFEHISLDLIYGTPGETDDDWRASLEAAISTNVDHISAYALIVEDGTALSRKVRSGQIAKPDDDVLADRYLIADDVLSQAGLHWYEVSNWAKDASGRCHHNELYWHNADWWGIGPGAHSHVDGQRWWNVKHPGAYSQALKEGSPEQDREILTPAERVTEQILLEIRLRDGLELSVLSETARREVEALKADGLLEQSGARAVLTLKGRLLADAVVRALT